MEAGCGSQVRQGRQRITVLGYVEALSAALGHADRGGPFRSYCTGLLLPGPRKSVEPMAARMEPGRVQAAHQSLHHLVAKADWSDEAVLTAVREQCCLRLSGMVRSAPGSSTTQGFLKRERIRSVWLGNIAVSLASRTIVRLR